MSDFDPAKVEIFLNEIYRNKNNVIVTRNSIQIAEGILQKERDKYKCQLARFYPDQVIDVEFSASGVIIAL